MTNLKQENIYAYNILRSAKSIFDKDYSNLISNLLHLESDFEYGNLEITEFAKKLMDIININGAFPKVDRACISVAHFGSSRISALSSHNSDKLKPNTMAPGYNCFVSTSSSLFKTKKSNVRIYSNIEHIIEKYQGQPVQRSLLKLSSMGVVSGVTIPLPISNLMSGMLFLNSSERGSFDHLGAEDYTILCLIKLVAMSCLKKAMMSVNGVDNSLAELLSEHQMTNKFSGQTFKELLALVIKSRFNKEVEIHVNNTVSKDFFLALNPTLYAITKILELSQEFIPEQLQIDFKDVTKPDGNYVELKIKKMSESVNRPGLLQELKLFSNMDIGIFGDFFVMHIPLDVATDVDYSL